MYTARFSAVVSAPPVSTRAFSDESSSASTASSCDTSVRVSHSPQAEVGGSSFLERAGEGQGSLLAPDRKFVRKSLSSWPLAPACGPRALESAAQPSCLPSLLLPHPFSPGTLLSSQPSTLARSFFLRTTSCGVSFAAVISKLIPEIFLDGATIPLYCGAGRLPLRIVSSLLPPPPSVT